MTKGKDRVIVWCALFGTLHTILDVYRGNVLCLLFQIIEKSADGWWTGRIDGSVGVFPASFVEMIKKPKTKEERKRLLRQFQQGRLGEGM